MPLLDFIVESSIFPYTSLFRSVDAVEERGLVFVHQAWNGRVHQLVRRGAAAEAADGLEDRKSTRLNSSHTVISYAVFCLKKKKTLNSKASTRFHSGGLQQS